MPQHKSAKKRLRKNEDQRTYNRAVRSRVQKVVKSAKSADDSTIELNTVYSVLDRAVKKGVIPANRAARTKSRLARRSTSKSPA